MVQKRINYPRIKLNEPSFNLDLSCSKEQVQDFVPGEKYLRNYSIIIFSHGYGDKMNLAMMKLYNIGYINPYGGVKNDPDSIFRLKNNLELSQSLVNISLLDHKDDHQEKYDIDTDMRSLAPAATDKLVVKGNGVSKLTKKEICAFLLTYFLAKEKVNKKCKGDIFIQFGKEI